MCTHNILATRKCTLLLQHMKFETSDGYIWFVSPLWLGHWTSLQQTAFDHHFVIFLHLVVESHQLSELKCSIKTYSEWATLMGWTLRCSQQYLKDLGQTAPCKGLKTLQCIQMFFNSVFTEGLPEWNLLEIYPQKMAFRIWRNSAHHEDVIALKVLLLNQIFQIQVYLDKVLNELQKFMPSFLI
jgi:hypothetical protein